MRLWQSFVLGLYLWSFVPQNSLFAVSAPRLQTLLMKINEREKELKANEEVYLVKGDEFRILWASLDSVSYTPELVNVIGFRAEGQRTSNPDDREISIPVEKLKRGWSIGKEGKRFLVEISGKGRRYGQVYLNVINPEVQSLRIEINGQPKTFRLGDSFTYRDTDSFKIDEVICNHDLVKQGIRMDFVDSLTEPGLKELFVYYRSLKLGSIAFRQEKEE